MNVEDEPFDRRLSRADMLRLAALAAGAGVVAGPAAAADAAIARLTKESGRLQVMDWAGYGNDGGQAMFAAYVHKYPNNKPQFASPMTNEANAYGRIRAGAHPDLFRPYVGWVKFFAQSGLVQPWNPKLISNFEHLNPFMVKAGQYGGKQYGIPDDWGFDAILYRSDKVHPKAKSWGLLFDERYKGKIAWFDDLEMITIAGLYLKAKNPWNQTSGELSRSVSFLKSKKHLARMSWSSETDLWQAFGSGGRRSSRSSTCIRRRSQSRGSACSCCSRTRRAHTSRTRTWMPGARRSPASGWRTTTATGTRTSRRSRVRASCSRHSSWRTPRR